MSRLFLICIVLSVSLSVSLHAQLEERFTLPKAKYLSGEPVLLQYTVRNTGSMPVTILQAFPNSFCSGYTVRVERTDVSVHQECAVGGWGGSCASSSVTLKPGQSRTEQYLANEHAKMRVPGAYHITARRELETSSDTELVHLSFGPKTITSAEFDIQVTEAEQSALRLVLQPYFADLHASDLQRSATASLVVQNLSSPVVEDLILQLGNDVRDHGLIVPALAAANTTATRKRLAAIASQGGDEASAAASGLGKSGDTSYWTLLQSLAKREPTETALPFIEGAARLGRDDAVPWLGELLRSADSKIRTQAIYALQFTASRRAIPLLIDAISDPDPDMAERAQFTLLQLTHRAFNPEQVALPDRAAARIAWTQWWLRHSAEAPIFNAGELCEKASPLD